MKKLIKSICLMMLIVPVAFAFTACFGGNKNNGDIKNGAYTISAFQVNGIRVAMPTFDERPTEPNYMASPIERASLEAQSFNKVWSEYLADNPSINSGATFGIGATFKSQGTFIQERYDFRGLTSTNITNADREFALNEYATYVSQYTVAYELHQTNYALYHNFSGTSYENAYANYLVELAQYDVFLSDWTRKSLATLREALLKAGINPNEVDVQIDEVYPLSYAKIEVFGSSLKVITEYKIYHYQYQLIDGRVFHTTDEEGVKVQRFSNLEFKDGKFITLL